MPYDNNVPLANQTIASSQTPINQNFAAIKTLIDINHETFTSPDQGKHKFVDFPKRAASADAPGAALQMTLFSKVSADTATSELYVRRNANANPVPFTAGLGAVSGWCFLPAGMIMKWGLSPVFTKPSNAFNQNFDIPISQGSAFTAVYSPVVSLYVTDAYGADVIHYYISAVSTTNITVSASNTSGVNRNFQFYYNVIGAATPTP